MLAHDEPGSLDLDAAKEKILSRSSDTCPLANVEDAVDAILHASRQSETRDDVRDESVFQALLKLYEETLEEESSPQQRRINLMKCIGNIVSYDDTCRALVVDSPTFLDRLSSSIRGVAVNLEEADTAVKVLYNICNDDASAQQAAFKTSLHISLLHYVDQHPWDDEDSQLALSVNLLSDIVQQKQHVQIKEDFDANWTALLLKLPCLDELEAENFLDAANVTIPYLADKKFQAAVLANQQLPLAFELLESTTFITPHLEEEEVVGYEKRLIHFLADVSSLPAFASTYTVDDDFIQVLCDRCVLTDNQADSTSLAVCACILLGNLCVSDEVAMDIPSKIKMDSLCDHICLQAYGRSRTNESAQSHADYLHAAAGLLRHLAMPVCNRQKYFGNETCRQAAMALVQFPQADVQCAGLRLYRQILNDEPKRLERFIASSYLSTTLRVFLETKDPNVKIEVAKLQLAHFRTLTRTLIGQPTSSLLPTIMDTEHILDPLIFAATQTTIPLAQAEGWLGLCLVARLPGGAPRVSRLFEQENMLEALSQEIKGHTPPQKGETKAVEENTATMMTGRRNSVPNWLKEKERDNAVVLVHDLLSNAEVAEPLRGKLETLLSEAGIRLVK